MEAKKSVPRENMAASKGPKTKKIFVGGIPPSITDGMQKCLRALASPPFVCALQSVVGVSPTYRDILIEPFFLGSERSPESNPSNSLPFVLSDEFKSYFSSFGSVVEHQIMQDHSTGRSRGFGFVTFDNEQVVEDILAHGKMHELGGKQVGALTFCRL